MAIVSRSKKRGVNSRAKFLFEVSPIVGKIIFGMCPPEHGDSLFLFAKLIWARPPVD
jgi:hypothetical protein